MAPLATCTRPDVSRYLWLRQDSFDELIEVIIKKIIEQCMGPATPQFTNVWMKDQKHKCLATGDSSSSIGRWSTAHQHRMSGRCLVERVETSGCAQVFVIPVDEDGKREHGHEDSPKLEMAHADRDDWREFFNNTSLKTLIVHARRNSGSMSPCGPEFEFIARRKPFLDGVQSKGFCNVKLLGGGSATLMNFTEIETGPRGSLVNKDEFQEPRLGYCSTATYRSKKPQLPDAPSNTIYSTLPTYAATSLVTLSRRRS